MPRVLDDQEKREASEEQESQTLANAKNEVVQPCQKSRGYNKVVSTYSKLAIVRQIGRRGDKWLGMKKTLKNKAHNTLKNILNVITFY